MRRNRRAASSSERLPASSARARSAAARTCAGRARARLRAARRGSLGERTPRTAAGRARRRTGRCSASPRRAAPRSLQARPPSRAGRPGRTSSTSSRPARPTSGARRPEARQPLLAEAELAVGDVLEHEEAVAARQFDERFAALRRQAHARRVLVVGDRVEQLRTHSQPRAGASSSSTWSPSSSSGTTAISAPNPRNAISAPRYVGPSTTTWSPGSRKVLPASSSASIAPLVITSSSSAGRRPCVASIRPASASSAPASPRVGAYWNALSSPVSANSARSAAARSRGKRPRVGESAGERDQARHPKQREDLRDPLPDPAARACCEQLVESARRRCYAHRTSLTTKARSASSRDEVRESGDLGLE